MGTLIQMLIKRSFSGFSFYRFVPMLSLGCTFPQFAHTMGKLAVYNNAINGRLLQAMKKQVTFLWFLTTMHTIAIAQGLPIKPVSTIRFRTTEGSYMDVDISPDGKTLLFDMLGDLYTLPASGGNTKQLTHGLALNTYPVWSKDGKFIAYLSDASGAGRIHIRDLSGSYKLVMPEGATKVFKTDAYVTNETLSWTREGYITTRNLFYSTHAAESVYPQAYKKADHSLGLHFFSSDGNYLYFTDKTAVVRLDRLVGTTKVLANLNSYIKIANIAISPDEHWLTYMAMKNQQWALIRHDLLNHDEKILAQEIGSTDFISHQHYAIGPDSRTVYIGFGGKIHRIDVASGEDSRVEFKADVKVAMGPFNYNRYKIDNHIQHVKYIRSPDLSPDGKHIVFSALSQIYVKQLPSGRPRLLHPDDNSQFQPAYSPDGKWIVYATWNERDGGALWKIPSQGGNVEKLSLNKDGLYRYQFPAFSPDGKTIAYCCDKIGGQRAFSNEIGRLELLNISNDHITILSDSIDTYKNSIEFSKDGKSLFCTKLHNPEGSIQHKSLFGKILIDSGEFSLIATNIGSGIPSEDISPFYIAISKDEKYLVYVYHDDVYLTKVNMAGKPIELGVGKRNGVASDSGLTKKLGTGLLPRWSIKGDRLTWNYADKFYSVSSKDPFSRSKTIIEVRSLGFSSPKLLGKGLIALQGARIITMKGKQVIEKGTVLIEDGRILKVLSGNASIPPGAKCMNMVGKTIIPGLIDMHNHLDKDEETFARYKASLLVNLAYGVTTVRDPSSSYGEYGYAESIEVGNTMGPRIYSSGVAVRRPYAPNSLKDALSIAQKRKVVGGTLIKQYFLDTRIERQLLAIASRNEGLNMTNEGSSSPLTQFMMIKDGSTGVEHNYFMEPGEIHDDIYGFLKRSKVFFTPTLNATARGATDYGDIYFMDFYKAHPDSKFGHWLTVNDYMTQFATPESFRTDTLIYLAYPKVAADLAKKGVRITMGSHGDIPGIGAHFEIWALQKGGLSNLEALRSGTILAAQGLGMQQDIGSIEPGKIADMIILNSNILDDIHNSRDIKYVMKNGVLYSGDTLDQVWPRNKMLNKTKKNAD